MKGLLLTGYIRMIRASRDVPWLRILSGHDLAWALRDIDPDEWYPLDAYDRLCVAAARYIGEGDAGVVRQWGQAAGERLFHLQRNLFAAGDPRETLMRFPIVRNAMFDFPVVQVTSIRDGDATLYFNHELTPRGEEATCHHSAGFLHRMLEIAGAEKVAVRMTRRSWEGHPSSVVDVSWTNPWHP